MNQKHRFDIDLSKDIDPWLPHLNLNRKDKEVLETESWLNDKHINAAQKLLSETYPTMGGLQDSKLTPFFVEKNKIWNVSEKFKPQNSPSLQIHFDGNSRWVCSFSPENE